MRNIAIEISKDRLWLASGSSHGGKAQLEHLAYRDLSDEQTALAALAELVKTCGLRGGRCTAVVRRGDVEVRTTELPTTTPSELPDMVRFATSRLFASASDSWPIDFLVLPAGGDEATRETTSVLAAAIPPALVTRLRTACEAAGLELHSIALGPVEVAAALGELPEADSAVASVLIVEPLLSSTELTSCTGGRVASVRSVRSMLDGGEDAVRDLGGEIRRTSLAAAGAGSPPRLIMLGGTLEGAASLGEAAGVTVERVPVGELAKGHRLTPAETEALSVAGAGGVVAAIAAGPHPTGKAGPPIKGHRIDFLDPRRYVEPPRSHLKLIAAGAGVAALLVFGLLAFWLQSRSLDAQIASLQEELAAGKQTVESSQQLIANQETIRGFVDRRANWLEEFAYVSEKALPAEQMIVGDINALAPAVSQSGVIAARVAVSERDLGPTVMRRLRDADHDVSVPGWNPTTGQASRYSWFGDVSVTVPLEDDTAWLAPIAVPPAGPAPTGVDSPSEATQPTVSPEPEPASDNESPPPETPDDEGDATEPPQGDLAQSSEARE